MSSGIHEILRTCRERAGLTQQELARKLHVERSTIAKVETGVIKSPSYALVKEWASATNSTDIIGLDFFGHQGIKRFRQFETTLQTIKKVLEPINLMRRRKV